MTTHTCPDWKEKWKEALNEEEMEFAQYNAAHLAENYMNAIWPHDAAARNSSDGWITDYPAILQKYQETRDYICKCWREYEWDVIKKYFKLGRFNKWKVKEDPTFQDVKAILKKKFRNYLYR